MRLAARMLRKETVMENSTGVTQSKATVGAVHAVVTAKSRFAAEGFQVAATNIFCGADFTARQ